MKFLSHVLAFLLATIIALSVSSWIFERTLWSAPYIEHHASETKLYTNLSSAVPEAVAAASPEAGASGLTNLDPALIQGQVQSLLPQFIDHIHRSGPAPTVDLVALTKAIGQEPPEGETVKTINFGTADAKITEIGQGLGTAGAYAPFAALALIILILVTMRSHRFPTLIKGGFDTAVGLAILAGLFWFLPNIVLQMVNKPDMASIKDAISGFVTALFHGMAGQFGIAALVFLALAIGLWFIHRTLMLKAKFTPKPKKPAKPAATPGAI